MGIEEGKALATFFDDEAEEFLANERLYKLLRVSVISVNITGRACLVFFIANHSVCIELFDFEIYRITISDPTLYLDSDTATTKLSKDRIFHYLEYIANVSIMVEASFRKSLENNKRERQIDR